MLTLAQLRKLGLSSSAVRSRVATGKLHPLHRGVYALGHAVLSAEARWLAAVLACGPAAVLSHRCAGALLGLRPNARRAVDVLVPRGSARPRPGIDLHRAASLRPADVTMVRGIPCTTVPRTLLDLAEVVPRQAVERALDQAEVLQVLDVAAVSELLDRSRGRRGAPVLAAILAAQRREPALTRNELEERFLKLCSRWGVPKPEVNTWIALDGGGVEVDFLWRKERLIVETDGRAAHGTIRAFEQDRRRDQRLLVAGWRVARCTWRQVTGEPHEVAATVRALLVRTSPRGQSGAADHPAVTSAANAANASR